MAADEEEEGEFEQFIKHTHALYSEYAISLADFVKEHSLIASKYELEDVSDDKTYKVYAEFSGTKEGELAREQMQTWICDNRFTITSSIHIALENLKLSFCNWFRDSEVYENPDELLLYCLGRQHNKHVTIFNKSYVWTTLSKHMRYDYFEMIEKSHLSLVFLGRRKYAILRKKLPPKIDTEPAVKPSGRQRSKKASTAAKTTCRTMGKRGNKTKSTTARVDSLADARQKQHGISPPKSSTM